MDKQTNFILMILGLFTFIFGGVFNLFSIGGQLENHFMIILGLNLVMWGSLSNKISGEDNED